MKAKVFLLPLAILAFIFSSGQLNATTTEDFESGDLTAFSWQFGGNADWVISTTSPHGGTYCAQSGDIGDGQTSSMYVYLTNCVAGNITFYHKVESEYCCDYLRFYIDGVLKLDGLRNTTWTLQTVAVTEGNHTFKWEYYKDGSVSTGADCAWIDDIVFPWNEPTPMEFASCTTETASTSQVTSGTNDNEIIRLNVVTTGSLTPISATSLTFNTTGTTDASGDINFANIYYTTSTTFSNSTQFGSSYSGPDGSFTVTGSQELASGNNYFWLAYDVDASSSTGDILDGQCTSVTVASTARIPDETNPDGSRSVLHAPIAVTATSGTTNGSYFTLKDAFDHINDGTHQGEITMLISDDITETASAVINASGGSASYTSIEINPSGGSARTISGSLTGAIIAINGGDNITIDGLNSGGNSLVIDNSNTGEYANAIRFYNSASGCTVTNCTILGSAGPTTAMTYRSGGPVAFVGNSSGACLNENIEISYCNIGPSGANKPAQCIDAGYNSYDGTTNNNITIDHCNIYDFSTDGGNSYVSAGIFMGGQSYNTNTNTNWTITNNSFYFTESQSISLGATICGIYIYGGRTVDIQSNYFGGSQASCGGSAMTITGNPYAVSFVSIMGHASYKGMSDATLSSINDNVIQNISISSTNSSIPSEYDYGGRFCAFSIHSGKFEINNNLVGSMASNESIILNDANQSKYFLIHQYGKDATLNIGPVITSISDNQIGGIRMNSAYSEFSFIHTDKGSTGYECQIDDISGNSFGSSLANSIYAPNLTNSSSTFRGISLSSSTVTNIDNNIMRNVSQSQGSIYGIQSPYSFNASGNQVYNLSTTSGATCLGITMSSNESWGNISVDNNWVSNLMAATTVRGISVSSFYNTISIFNNIVTLGEDISENIEIRGIYCYYLLNVYHNTVYIGGEGTSGSTSSSAFFRDESWTNSTYIYDNLFQNSRTNNGGSGSHYACYIGSSYSLNGMDYNNYYADGSGGIMGHYGSTDYTTMAAWRSATAKDSHSLNLDASFVNQTGSIPDDFTPLEALSGHYYSTYSSDYNGFQRNETAPTMGALEGIGNTWTGDVSTAWEDQGNWSEGVVPTAEVNVYIPDVDNDPVITSATGGASCLNLTVGTGATISINNGGSLITYGGLSNNGTFNISKSITEGTWHLVSIPVTSGTAATFEGDYLQYWTESTAAWTDVTETTYELTPAMGYGLWGVAKGNHTYTFSGTPNNGDQSLAITDVGSGGSYNGANLLGNPYPSSIDWSGLDDTYGAVYYWNGSAYVSWNAGSGDGSQYIPPMQGFFIIADGNGTFSVSNSDRTHSGATSYYKSASAVEQGLVLYADNGNYRDALWIQQREEASAGFDYHSDALKFMSNTPGLAQLWSVSTDGNLSIDSRPYQESIVLGFANDVAGFYSIGIDQIAGITIATLEDTQENVFHDLTKGAYSFTWDPADDEGRFILHLGPTGVEDSPQMNNDLLIYAHDGDLHLKAVTGTQQGTLTITDMAGRTLYQSELTIDGEMKLDTGLSTGVYVVRFNTGKDVRVKKIIIN